MNVGAFGFGVQGRFKMTALADDPTMPGYPKAYFSWLGWVLLAAAGITALAACLPTTARASLRVVAATLGVIGFACTVFAVVVLMSRLHLHGTDALRILSVGCYLAMAGFLAITLGGGALATTSGGVRAS